MKRNLGLATGVLVLIMQVSAASAQWGNYFVGPPTAFVDSGVPVDPATTFVLVEDTRSCAAGTTTCVGWIPLSRFASGPQIQSEINALNGQMSRAFELIAVAAAMKDAIPNAGDRFAVRLNAAAFNGQAAGAIGFSYNVNDTARLSLNYGQGASRAIVSGGLNLSFR